MENSINNQNEQVEEEIPTIEQFQVGRSTPEEKDLESINTTAALTDGDTAEEDAGYTSEEVEFADGEGTLLDEELSVDPEDDDLEGDDLEDDGFEDDDLEDDDVTTEDEEDESL